MEFDTKRIRSESIFSKKLWTVKDTLVFGFFEGFLQCFSAMGEAGRVETRFLNLTPVIKSYLFTLFD